MTETTGGTGVVWGAAQVRAAVEAYWAAAGARDWSAFAATLADDVVYDLPQSRERILGKERYVRFNREYPGDWQVRAERIVADGEGRQAAARTLVTLGPEETHAIHFFTFDADGRIVGVTDFWPEPYEPPAGREHLVERY
ncbi:nuclear transport factor 2 family protein [Streptomyces sp. JH34]|uniref:nuclear transport factor 2 family protein n=1 Tax=Streptomyces sp. JH34 TaxID=2793633 RepID=UPI0023F84C8E|nr:nuclear transport factor 2 family protein [Streptomyces sp. JH34]MDF6020215.1 nuclear transport factor 2 family protein [Streptomyces sp. JH34]